MKRILAALILVVLSALPAAACGDGTSKLVGFSVNSRCIHRNVTIVIDPPNGTREDRQFITLSDADGRQLYENLKPFYGGAR